MTSFASCKHDAFSVLDTLRKNQTLNQSNISCIINCITAYDLPAPAQPFKNMYLIFGSSIASTISCIRSTYSVSSSKSIIMSFCWVKYFRIYGATFLTSPLSYWVLLLGVLWCRWSCCPLLFSFQESSPTSRS